MIEFRPSMRVVACDNGTDADISAVARLQCADRGSNKKTVYRSRKIHKSEEGRARDKFVFISLCAAPGVEKTENVIKSCSPKI